MRSIRCWWAWDARCWPGSSPCRWRCCCGSSCRAARQIPLLALSAFCGFIGFPLLYSIGQRMTSAMHGGLILAALPIFTGLVAAAMERRRPSGRWWLGCLIALAGEVVLVTGRGALGQGQFLFDGRLAGGGLECPGLDAAMSPGRGSSQMQYASLGTTLWGATGASILLLPVLPLAAGGWSLPAAGPVAWGAVAFLAWMSSHPRLYRLVLGAGAGGIARMGTIQFLQPLSGLVLAFFLLDERPSAGRGAVGRADPRRRRGRAPALNSQDAAPSSTSTSSRENPTVTGWPRSGGGRWDC